MTIFDYAKVSDWESRLHRLAGIAEPERWTFTAVPDEASLPILDAYVRYTFLRVQEQGKIAETDDIACFNTGLLTPSQEEVFAVFRISDRFEPSRPVSRDNRKWFLSTWARSGERVLTDFMELPGLATYWTDPAELVFDPERKVQPNLEHIIRHNLNRFPSELGGCLDRAGVPTDLTGSPDIEAEASASDQAQDNAMSADPSLEIPLATRNALDGAMKHSICLSCRSYRIAVPQFYRGRIQLLLPLYLRDTARPDLALTLERHGKWYRAATVLYPDWAYRHARLLARPNSEWLGGFRTDRPSPAADGP